MTQHRYKNPIRRLSVRHAVPLTLAGLIIGTVAYPTVAAADTTASWNPVASERLIKLPPRYLKKSIDSDFTKSGLAAVLLNKEEEAGFKRQTLSDLMAATDHAEGELRIELRHQFLAEKQAYLQIMKEHQDLRRKQARTKIRLYERLLRKVERERGAMTPQRTALVTKQKEARQRFEANRNMVDTKLFHSTMATESRYAREYAKNLVAIEKLFAAIQAHPMIESNVEDGEPVSKPDFLRRLIAETEADLAVIDQEHTILGYMAKLTSLDALALSESIDEIEGGNDDLVVDQPSRGLTTDIDFFVKR